MTATHWILGVLGTIVAAIVIAALLTVAAHIANSDKHPKKQDIVFKDVCEAKEDCLEREIKNLKETVDKGFTEIKAILAAKQN